MGGIGPIQEKKMNRHDIRYTLEHKILPKWFFEEKQHLIGALLQDHHILYRVVDDLFRKEDLDNPYTAEQFDIVPVRLDDKNFMLEVFFPEPEESPLCYHSLLFFDSEFEKTGFFTIEKGPLFGDGGKRFVCRWTADGTHANFGSHKFEEGEDIKFCISLFLSKE